MSERKSVLRITSTGNDIVIDFDGESTGATGSVHRFRLGLSADLPEWARTLLYRAINHALHNFMLEIRKQAYDDGWRDAKSRRQSKVPKDMFWSDFAVRDRSY